MPLKKKILVVDDESTQRLLLSNLLQSVPHYQVIEAYDGPNALEMLKKEQVDLIILDVMMPVMDGFETLAAIRKDAELSRIPVIMCTAVNKREDIMRILQQGVAGYIVKPVNKKTLLPKVQQTLGEFDDASNQTAASESYHAQPPFTSLAIIADEDRNFCKIVENILSPYYNIIQVEDENSLEEHLSVDEQPQVILLGKLVGTLNIENLLSNPFIQQKKTKVYRVFSTADEVLNEMRLEYHGRMLRTLDINLLHSRFREMGILPDLTISYLKWGVVVQLKNSYLQSNEEMHILFRAIVKALKSDAQRVRFDLSNWDSESMEQSSETETLNKVNTPEIASQYLRKIIMELKSLGVKIEVVGYTPPEGSSLAALLKDQDAESRQKYIDYLTPRINRLREYCKAADVEAIYSLASNLSDFGEEHGLSRISILADIIIQEASKNHLDVVQVLIQRLLLEKENIAEDSAKT